MRALGIIIVGALVTKQPAAVRVEKLGDRATVISGTFAVRREVLFGAITEPEHLKQWLSAGPFRLADVAVDGRVGGSFRYTYRRPNGRTIEVRGAYKRFDPPRGHTYIESYDFSPLKIDVSTTLDAAGDNTQFTQTMRYASTAERDEDFNGVASSSREAYAKLARYLTTLQRH